MLSLVQPSKPVTGELIVRNGVERGTSRPLLVPFTLVGSADHCDLRIIDFLVRPVHCAVSVTPDGPHLRSLGGSTTIVNGLPTQERLLQAGDIVTIGPIELEVHWYLPPAPLPSNHAIDPTTPQEADAPATNEGPGAWPAKKIARLRNRLAHGRLQLQRERQALRQDLAQQLIEVGELRTASENLKIEAVLELANLRKLRRQFLRQWKRYWRRRRLHVERAETQLARDQSDLEKSRQQFAEEYARFQAERGALQDAHDACRRRCQRLENELAEREQEITRREAAVDARERQQARERTAAQQLREEIAGLEARIQQLRAALPVTTPNLPPVVPSPTVRTPTLQALANDLADQQRVLTDQVHRFASIVTTHTRTHADLSAELAELTTDLLRREHEQNQKNASLVEQQAHLTIWQTRLLDQQIDLEQQSQQVTHAEQRMARREARLTKLRARWATRRQTELTALRHELEQVALLRGHVEHQRALVDDRAVQLAQHAQALLLEQQASAQQGPRIAQERLRRRLRVMRAKNEAVHASRRAEWQADADALTTLHTTVLERLSFLAGEQHEVASALAELDHRAVALQHAEAERLARLQEADAEQRLQERALADLRAEVARLTALLDQQTGRPFGPRRAA